MLLLPDHLPPVLPFMAYGRNPGNAFRAKGQIGLIDHWSTEVGSSDVNEGGNVSICPVAISFVILSINGDF
jgi:hypothetical protein